MAKLSITQAIVDINATDAKAKKVMKRLISDVRSRAPGWIAGKVVEHYGIKRKDIPKLSHIKVKGKDVMHAKVIYTGRVLTPTHFGMTPKTPKDSYTLKAEIVRGEKKVLGKKKKLTKKQRARLSLNFEGRGAHNSPRSPIMLMNAGGGKYIPFQRKSQRRNDIEAVKTLSVPQMVSSPRTKAAITETINDNLSKRMAHHMKLLQQ